MLLSITPSIFTTAKSAIERFTPIERDCYSDDEFKLPNLIWDGGYRYSLMNCLYEGAIQKIMSNCSCFQSSSEYNVKNLPICTGRKLWCAKDWLSYLGSAIDPDLTIAIDTNGQSLKCLQRCDLQTEAVTGTLSTFPNKNTFYFRQEFCYVLQKISKICTKNITKQIFQSEYQINNICGQVLEMNNTLKACNNNDKPNIDVINSNPQISEFLFDYASKNLAVIKIFIKDPYYTRYIKSEQLTFLSFIANAGGLIGLCMGMSFISIFEIVYHLGNFLFAKLKYNAFSSQAKIRNIINIKEIQN